jgi:hypothetical protein
VANRRKLVKINKKIISGLSQVLALKCGASRELKRKI